MVWMSGPANPRCAPAPISQKLPPHRAAMALRPASSLPRCQGAPLVLHGHPLARERASSASPPPPRCCAVPRLAEGRNAAGRLLGLQAAPPPRQRRLSASEPRHRRWSARRARLVSLGGRRAISHQGIMRRRAQGGKVGGAWLSRAAERCQRHRECGGGAWARKRQGLAARTGGRRGALSQVAARRVLEGGWGGGDRPRGGHLARGGYWGGRLGGGGPLADGAPRAAPSEGGENGRVGGASAFALVCESHFSHTRVRLEP